MGSEFPLTALGEKKDLKNVFFLVYQLSPPWAVGWHLQLGLVSAAGRMRVAVSHQNPDVLAGGIVPNHLII